ncbi:MAG: DUF1361 domain-containing protein [Chloracidobacterium sp.]|nr:DUF1361 domain-containing protein [Chloracidobacterium sp.]MDW8217176.1 DUF1361 domain-containing protein [Acidobacteriota bacterium]
MRPLSLCWGRLSLTLGALGLAAAWCIGLVYLRWRLTDSPQYLFLAWNLLLAAIPLGFALWLSRIRRRSVGLAVLAGWLLFFPNAPYVITDFIHLSPSRHTLLWFDVLLLASFAVVALWLGLVSLHLVHEWVAARFSVAAGWFAAIAACPLAGFGVYLGRYGRWNSWDALWRPAALLADVATLVTTPAAARAGGITLGFAGFLLVTYVVWRAHGGSCSVPSDAAARR